MAFFEVGVNGPLNRRYVLAVLSACVALLVLLVLPGSAGAQATRTWVSGDMAIANDANPCSRSAPCLTFARAIMVTAAGGEIDALTSGGFGSVTITKPITLSGEGVTAGVLVSGTNGITIDTTSYASPDTAAVTLRDLDFDGIGTGLSAVKVVHAGAVRLEDDQIYGFNQPAINFSPTAAAAGSPTPSLSVDDSTIHDNAQAGLLAIPPPGKTINVFVTRSTFENNGCGLVASTLAVTPLFTSAGCGVASSGTPQGTVNISSTGTSITGTTGSGVMSSGSGATNVLSSDMVAGNGTGLSPVANGQIVSVGSDNAILGNTTDGAPTSTQGGATGPAGQNGSNGSNGSNGKIELVTCKTVTVTVKKKVRGKTRKVKVKRQKCTGKLVSGPVKFTITGKAVHATLSRSNRVVATGMFVANGEGTRGLLTLARGVRTGWYTLTISRHHKVLSRRAVHVA